MASRNLLTEEVVAGYIACVVGAAFAGCKADVDAEPPSLVPPCGLQSRQIIYWVINALQTLLQRHCLPVNFLGVSIYNAPMEMVPLHKLAGLECAIVEITS